MQRDRLIAFSNSILVSSTCNICKRSFWIFPECNCTLPYL